MLPYRFWMSWILEEQHVPIVYFFLLSEVIMENRSLVVSLLLHHARFLV
jgi:hypothetical protein